jgi:hypothetical protein
MVIHPLWMGCDHSADVSTATAEGGFSKSRWFTRGWTLQELIAPQNFQFLSKAWEPIGGRAELASDISQITKVSTSILKNPSKIKSASVARRMSWASNRVTTREEDIAYCLLGIFDVNMPLLYGEGSKAFTRLQEEIIKVSADQSLFTWTGNTSTSWSILAYHPRDFAESSDIVPHKANTVFTMTNKGLNITLPVIWIKGRHIGILACHKEGDFRGPIGLVLRRIPGEEGSQTYVRSHCDVHHPLVDYGIRSRTISSWQAAKPKSIFIENYQQSLLQKEHHAWIRALPGGALDISAVLASNMESSWDSVTRTLTWIKRPQGQQYVEEPTWAGSIGILFLHHKQFLRLTVHVGVYQDGPSATFHSALPCLDISMNQCSDGAMDAHPSSIEHILVRGVRNGRAILTTKSTIFTRIEKQWIMGKQVFVIDVWIADSVDASPSILAHLITDQVKEFFDFFKHDLSWDDITAVDKIGWLWNYVRWQAEIIYHAPNVSSRISWLIGLLVIPCMIAVVTFLFCLIFWGISALLSDKWTAMRTWQFVVLASERAEVILVANKSILWSISWFFFHLSFSTFSMTLGKLLAVGIVFEEGDKYPFIVAM